MLTLKRVLGESIVITVPPSDREQKVYLHLLSLCGRHAARIGIDADPAVKILRTELLERAATSEEGNR